MVCRCRSRIVGAVSAVSLGTALERGGTIDGRLGITRGDLAIDAVLIVSTVGSERGDRAIDLIEQRPDLRGIVDVAGGQRRRRDLPGVGIHGDVQLAPGPPCLRAVLLEQPFARAAKLQPGAVHQQVHGTGAWPRTNHIQRLGPAAQGGVVRHREIEAEQGDDGADQSFGLPQRQAEHRSQRQRRRNSQGRIARLTASRGPRFSLPGLRLPRR